MNNGVIRTPVRGLASLRQLTRKTPVRERCDLCSITLAERHQHLIDPQMRRLLCACDACALLFSDSGQTKYRRVPRSGRRLSDFRMTNELWNILAIPIGLVFFFRSSASRNIAAVYPSPAGPTETILDEESWEDIVAGNPALGGLSPDVEALLVNRIHNARDYFLAPIDECYKLTGLIRKHWRGFSGGEEAWEKIRAFFDDLQQRSIAAPVNSHA